MRRGKVSLVPTMGALHDGHLSLMRRARAVSDTLVVSLFVNPTQFGPGEDFNRYPRDEETDAQMAEGVGVDILFAPSVEEMFPRKTTTVSVHGISDIWEGAVRPGHFDGVATVVCKLFNICNPDIAFFGLKDLQQCAVIRRMVEDLNIPVDLEFCETVREPDGLAMSSRNAYLTPDQRQRAPAIYQELLRCAKKFEFPQISASGTRPELEHSRLRLEELGLRVDYFELVNTFDLSIKPAPEPGDSIIAAARVGPTRLIDNIQIN